MHYKGHTIPEMEFVELKTADGLKLSTGRYPCKSGEPRAVVVMFHGFGSYFSKYAYMAKEFAT